MGNTSRIDLGHYVSLKLFYGGSWQKDDYTVNALEGGKPPGSLSKYGVFSETTLDWNMFSLTGGLRYDHWGLNGYQAPITAGMGSCPTGDPNCGGTNVDTSGGRWSPRLTLSAKPLPWLQPYATYSETFRPPTVQETFFSLMRPHRSARWHIRQLSGRTVFRQIGNAWNVIDCGRSVSSCFSVKRLTIASAISSIGWRNVVRA